MERSIMREKHYQWCQRLQRGKEGSEFEKKLFHVAIKGITGNFGKKFLLDDEVRSKTAESLEENERRGSGVPGCR